MFLTFTIPRIPLIRLNLITGLLLFFFSSSALSQTAEYFSESSSEPITGLGWLSLDPDLMIPMQDFQNRQTEKQLTLLQGMAGFESPRLALGSQIRASALLGRTNSENRFPYLGRFPTDFSGNTASDARLLQGNLSFAASGASWVHGYGELLFSDVFSFPSANQGSLQMRQLYMVFGDFETSPFYAFIGKKNTSFGDMGTLSPFSQSVVWHYFGGLSEGAGVGYANNGFEATVTGLAGGRGIRVVDSPRRGQLNNFAVNASYNRYFGSNGRWRLGAGYLGGTIYDAETAEHTDGALFGPRNEAWDINSELQYNRWTFAGEYVSTLNPWPTTGARVEAFRLEMAYDAQVMGRPMRLSTSWSKGIQGPSGSEFESNEQIVLGLKKPLSPFAFVTVEYVRSMGFAPLINITTASDRDVVQNSLVLGFVLTH